MTINERVKEVRTATSKSMEEFGKKLNVSRTAISLIESGKNNVSERIIADIIREFGVNENWLRDGEGDMFLDKTSEEELIEMFGIALVDDSELAKKKKALIRTLLRLDEGQMKVLADIAEDWVKNME